MKKGVKTFDKARVMNMDTPAYKNNPSRGDISSGHIEAFKYKQPYVSWNKAMDHHLATVLAEQMALGNKCDGDTWKPQALQAAVTYLNSTLHLTLTKDNIKNRLKNWKKHFSVISDIQINQSGFVWDEDRKMIVVSSDMWSAWTAYVESHPDAKGMANKVIDNWEDIVLLCGKDRATGQGAETFEEYSEAMGEEEEIEINSVHISSNARARPTTSTDSMLEKKKKHKQDSMVEVIGKIATSFQEFVSSKKKVEEKPSGIEIHEVVSMIDGLSREEVFKAVRKLMNGDPEEFKLLKALPDDEKKEWIWFLIDS